MLSVELGNDRFGVVVILCHRSPTGHDLAIVAQADPPPGCIVTIELGDTTLRVTDPDGELLTIVPRNSTGEISRFKAYGSKHSH